MATSFLAELWTLRDGLSLCKNLNLLFVEIEMDAKAMVELLANPLYSNRVAFHLLMTAGS